LASNGADGTDMIYVDVVNGLADTIRVFIPAEINSADIKMEKNEKPAGINLKTNAEEINSGIKNEVKSDTVAVAKKEEVKPESKTEKKVEDLKEDSKSVAETELKNEPVDKTPKFINITLPNPNAKADTLVKPATTVITEKKQEVALQVPEKQKESNAKPVMINSDCKATATEDDFLKLRKKMAAENNDDDMITVAKKVFKSKCFTTDQIKNLSVLFLKDDGKYKFFDAAYPFTSDSYNFSSLETQLTDNYFISRFKVMIRH
jgi:hypothetical protein